ncbi:uncharacterized protein LOC142977383 [Anticarsia gemmatalis]|uniref:uncharacterized protein LOC142977383 n=1 Tax=Anticarsia gemmatalis TaxID=129554 RepID=UPI003F764A48
MDLRDLYWVIVLLFSVNGIDAMTRAQMKNTGKLMRNSCMKKIQVTDDLIGGLEQGNFIEDKKVMCYIACVFEMTGVVKNNKINYEASIKQIDMMYPPDMKESAKGAAVKCKDVPKKYKDLCEASYWSAKCMYEYDPKNFFFPVSNSAGMMAKELCWLMLAVFFADGIEAMTRAQLKKTGKLIKTTCMKKLQVTEDEVGNIEKGKFIEERKVMCYMTCVLEMSGVVKNNKINHEASIKQIDMMYPAELKEPAKAAANHCKDVHKKYKDICEASYWTTKCLYEFSPDNFVFV